MRYLGLELDSRWRFEAHFDRLVPRVQGVATLLDCLMPNLGGPEERVRRLYVGVVRSMALYESPVWTSDLMTRWRSRMLLCRVQRHMAIRVARGYRTISHEAAAVLAGVVPFDLQAETDADIYRPLQILRRSGAAPPDGAVEEWRRRARLMKVLTGHGCFGEYLLRIGAEATAECHQCGAEVGSAQHMLEECPAFWSERRALKNVVGWDLSPPTVVAAMVESEGSWRAMSSFCEAVLSRKEDDERVRERSDPVRIERKRMRRAGWRRLPTASTASGGAGPF
ncbi:uncharacterized protein LOC128875122 [Hylaeus volcanicus]|uniref:uncharacterized protein LOC128875122 n=1 Tax=Hylaeus volcanicus TaxID=313075 RepID=UPI0023B7D0F8|nr:uncharacterized protein LOC128875122 [Hylaeus volcanicus]